MNDVTVTALAVEALCLRAARGELTVEAAHSNLLLCGGSPHTDKNGAELYRFAGQSWEVEVLAANKACILWLRAM